MLHVKQIRDIVSAGQSEEAHAALDQLLSLGPSNLEALKLRAQLLEFEGRFVEEAQVWDRIAQVDREDPDAIGYYLRKQLEDREHFYFTDDLPGGGRRFMAYPRGIIRTSTMGLFGCILFLVATRLASAHALLADPILMLGLFTLFVIVPWIGIVVTYFGSIKSVSVTQTGIVVATRLRQIGFLWTDLEKVCLARDHHGDRHTLSLVFVPKDRASVPLELDLAQGSTAIRARSYFIREVARAFSEPEYLARDALKLDPKRLLSF